MLCGLNTNILIKYCLQLNVWNPFIISLCVDCNKFSVDQVCEIFLGPKYIRQAHNPVKVKVSVAIVPDTHLVSQKTLHSFFLQIFRLAIWQEQTGVGIVLFSGKGRERVAGS